VARRAVYPHRGSGYQLKIDDPARYQTLEEHAPKRSRFRVRGGSHHFLLVRFLTSAFSIKLEDLADEWFVSRATLQSDMAEVRERFQRYQLTRNPPTPRHEAVWQRSVDSRLPDRSAVGAGAAGGITR
jgi:transcriptional antiterminator